MQIIKNLHSMTRCYGHCPEGPVQLNSLPSSEFPKVMKEYNTVKMTFDSIN
jgi:hypothetical protein